MTDTIAPASSGPGADAVATEIRGIETTMRERPAEYWRDQPTQERYRGLLTAREAGTGAPAKPDAVGQEIEAIERLMRTDKSAYDRDPALSARYLELLTSRESGATMKSETPVAEARKGLPADVIAEWDDHGATERNIAAVNDALRPMLRHIDGEGQAAEFIASFDVLPSGIRSAALHELAAGVPTFVKAASKDALKAFTDTPLGRAFAAEWGQNAARRYGVVQARWGRFHAKLSPADAKAFDRWFDAISDTERASMLWNLAS